MPIPLNAVRSVIGGHLSDGEVWEISQWWDGTAQAGDETKADALNGYVAGSVDGNLFNPSMKALYPTTMGCDYVRSYFYWDGTGKASYVTEATDSSKGTNAAGAMPNQVAIVVTTLTGRPGRSFRGRAYLPMIAQGQIGATGQLTQALCNTIATSFSSFLSGVKDAAGGAPPVIASRTRSAMTDVLSVNVDSLPDTQRRRRNKSVASFHGTGTVS